MSIKIDKSLFSAEELAQYEALIAKAKVDPEAASKEMEEEEPPFPPKKPPVDDDVEDELDKKCKTEKSADPALAAALEELATLKKSFEMKEMTQVAKKYAPLGKKEDELANTLYEMKKSNEANYNAYIAVLDESLEMVEKSGLFAEIGKSSAGSYSGPVGVEAKVHAKATEIMKSHPDMDFNSAIARAWDENPDLFDEYDKEYFG